MWNLADKRNVAIRLMPIHPRSIVSTKSFKAYKDTNPASYF